MRKAIFYPACFVFESQHADNWIAQISIEYIVQGYNLSGFMKLRLKMKRAGNTVRVIPGSKL